MRVETLCYVSGPSGGSETVWLRVNSKVAEKGDLAGTSLQYAERLEDDPKLIFLASEHTPARGNVYIIDDVEGYRVEHLEAQDGITITAHAVRLKKTDVQTYQAPGG